MPYETHSRSHSVDRREDSGPFDIIGDVHGCADELERLLERLGYAPDAGGVWRSPAGRTAVFVGDLVDRGPRIVDALAIAMGMVAAGTAFAVPGNHDLQLAAYLRGEAVPVVYGMDTSLDQLDQASRLFRRDVVRFFNAIKGHYVFDGGALVVAHTGLAEEHHGVDTLETRLLAAYGVIDEEIDANDPARRHPWLAGYQGRAAVVYGHTPIAEPTWVRQTIDIDTGCVFGWRLTALRWPERELVWVDAKAEYAHSHRDFY